MGSVDDTVEDRQSKYGHPFDNFSKTAHLWMGYLTAKGVNVLISPEDVGQMMILAKQAREMYGHNEDNTHDIAGYAKCLDMIAERREQQSVHITVPEGRTTIHPPDVSYGPPHV